MDPTPNDRDRVDAEMERILRETDMTKKTPYPGMGKDVRNLPLGEQFQITNDRMLAVRDDLTYVLNTRISGVVTTVQNGNAVTHGRFADMQKMMENIFVLTNETHTIEKTRIEDLQFEIMRLKSEMHREFRKLHKRWYRSAWQWLRNKWTGLESGF